MAALLTDKEVLGAMENCAAALVGFTGIIVTLVINSRNSRRAERLRFDQSRTIVEETIAHDTEVLRRGLLAELVIMRDTFWDEILYINQGGGSTYVPQIKADSIYNENIPRLGLLNGNAVAALVRAHSTYQERLGYVAARGAPAGTSGAIIVDLTDLDEAAHMKNDLNEIVLRAVDAITELSPPTSILKTREKSWFPDSDDRTNPRRMSDAPSLRVGGASSLMRRAAGRSVETFA